MCRLAIKIGKIENHFASKTCFPAITLFSFLPTDVWFSLSLDQLCSLWAGRMVQQHVAQQLDNIFLNSLTRDLMTSPGNFYALSAENSHYKLNSTITVSVEVVGLLCWWKNNKASQFYKLDYVMTGTFIFSKVSGFIKHSNISFPSVEQTLSTREHS